MGMTPQDYKTIYMAACKDDEVAEVLNRNGASNMTVCPYCHVDDFMHVEGCQMQLEVSTMLSDDLERMLQVAENIRNARSIVSAALDGSTT